MIVASSVIVGATSPQLSMAAWPSIPAAPTWTRTAAAPASPCNDRFAHVLALLDLGTTTWPGYTPVFHSSIVNAATGCTQIGVAIAVTDDQRGTPRPQGAKCDLGAIEGDYIFSDGFGT